MSEVIKTDAIPASDALEKNEAPVAVQSETSPQEETGETVAQIPQAEEAAPAPAVEEEAPAAQEPAPAPQQEEEAPAPVEDEGAVEGVAHIMAPTQEETPKEEKPARNPEYEDKSDEDLLALLVEATADSAKAVRRAEVESLRAELGKRVSALKAATPSPEEGSEDFVNPAKVLEDKVRRTYNSWRKELEAENLATKQGLCEELKGILDSTQETRALLPKVREIQAKWKETGPVPQADYEDLEQSYRLSINLFYDKVHIERELRDLDYKKNLEVKTELCEKAEALAESEDIPAAFRELQKLHTQWKSYGPVSKDMREAIWERFRAATGKINQAYQNYMDAQRSQQADIIAAKTAICEKAEAIAAAEVKGTSQWASYTTDIEKLQEEWKGLGRVFGKESQKLYSRFKEACDVFFNRKKEYYKQLKSDMNENLNKKLAIIEKAEALKDSTDWKKTAEEFVALQKEWKEIGTVPRKKTDALWKRFRAACDYFFDQRDAASAASGRSSGNYHANLKAKQELIKEILAFSSDDPQVLSDAAEQFAQKWDAIGFVPFKDKETIQAAYKDAMAQKFPSFGRRDYRRGSAAITGSEGGRRPRREAPMTEKDRLVQQYNALQQEIATYENNLGFFSASKTAELLISQAKEKIEKAKAELKALEEKIISLSQGDADQQE